MAVLEEFGRVDLKSTRQERGGHPIEYATLNEQQSTLLLTYMRNSGIVRQFKKALVKAFWELKNGEASGPKIPKTLGQALYLAAKLEDEREALAKKVAEDKPKVDFFHSARIGIDEKRLQSGYTRRHKDKGPTGLIP